MAIAIDNHPERQRPLGEFLRSRRERLTPEAVGLVSYGARRVPGLRREELAQLAGVSATYYTRLEQGQSTNASRSVIEALARALQLDDDERAPPARPRPPRAPARRARAGRAPERRAPSTLQLVAAMTRRARRRARPPHRGAGLEPARPPAAGRPLRRRRARAARRPAQPDADAVPRPAHARALPRLAGPRPPRAVASLRLVAGRFPDDRPLEELVGELTVKSPEFAALWARQAVANCVSGTKRLHHPEVGELDLEFQALQLPDDSGQRLLTYTALPGSPVGGRAEAAAAIVSSLRINHVSVNALDLQESVDFYTELLGADLLPTPNFGLPVQWLKLGDTQLHLFERDLQPTSHHHLGITVEDVEPVYRVAEARGAFENDAFGNHLVELPGDIVQLYVRDPAGNLVEIDHHGVDRLPDDLRARLKQLWDLHPQSDENMAGRLFVS